MTDLKPFPIYHAVGDEPDWDRLKRLKLSMPELPRVQFTVASKSTAERILAWGAVPGQSRPWICDYALVTPATTDERLAQAVHWVLTDEIHPKATTAEDMLTKIFGPGTREITAAELAAEQKARDYIDGKE